MVGYLTNDSLVSFLRTIPVHLVSTYLFQVLASLFVILFL